MNAQIILTEVWKALHTKNSPLNIDIPTINLEQRISRSQSIGRLLNKGYTNGTQSTFINDSKKVWNSAPKKI